VRLAVLAALAASFVFGAATTAHAASSLPAGFEDVTLAGNFDTSGAHAMVQAAWAPDGRLFVADREGMVFVHNPGTAADQHQEVLDIRDHVNNAPAADRGLLGIATDTDFESNGYLYLLYTYDLPANSDDAGRRVSTLTRVTVNPDNSVAGGQVDPTEFTVIGHIPATIGSGADGACGAPSNTNDCIPSEGTSHSIGTVRTAPDGTLYVGTGDGNDYKHVDPLTFNDNNPQTYRGKIMHIDRNGHGLPGHPFCPADNDLSHVCTKIFAEGLRNPFRFTLTPGGELAIGDVGENNWEELDLAHGGEDFGWPCWEGNGHTPFDDGMGNRYDTTSYCQARYAAGDTPAAPALAWSHISYPATPEKCGGTPPHGNAAIGGPMYMGDQYPAGYRGTIFFADFICQWLSRAVVSGGSASLEPFSAATTTVDLETAPDGNLALLTHEEVHEIVYGPGNHRPSVSPSATPDHGTATLGVTFHAGGSDPDNDALTYDWDPGDGSPHLDGESPGHLYTHPGSYTATVTVDDGRGMTATASLPITVSAAATVKQRPRLTRVRLSPGAARRARRGLLRGSFTSAKSIRSLHVSVWRGRAFARSCRWWSRRSHALKRGECKQPHWLRARLHRKGRHYTWTLRLGARLPRGSYTLVLKARPRSSGFLASEPVRRHVRVRR
jgi:glucose/arabinose dehydrogenase